MIPVCYYITPTTTDSLLIVVYLWSPRCLVPPLSMVIPVYSPYLFLLKFILPDDLDMNNDCSDERQHAYKVWDVL